MNETVGSWRDSGREAKLWVFSSSASFPVLLFLFNISWGTLGLVVVTIAALSMLDYYGFKPIVFARYLRVLIGGRAKPPRPWWL